MNDASTLPAPHDTEVSFLSGQAQRRFERQVRAYRHRVIGFGVNFIGDRTEAEEVTQEVLLRLWQHSKAVDDDCLLGWLLRVTRNAYIDCPAPAGRIDRKITGRFRFVKV